MRSLTKHAVRAVAVLLACVALSACADTGGEEEAASAAKVVPIKGQDVSRVTLTDDAARRIGLKLDSVGTGAAGVQIPYGAVLYDPDGASWTFVNTGPLTYVRQPITVERIEGGVAFLKAGPPAGSKVVSVGATELYGAENGVGDDE